MQPGGFEKTNRPRGMSGGGEPFVRHEQRAFAAKLPRQHAHALQGVRAEDEAGSGLGVEAGGVH